MTYFTEKQVQLLLARLHPDRVLKRDGMSYVEGYDIRAELTRIFGFGRWSSEVLDQALICEVEKPTKGGRDAWYVVYRSRVRLTIHAPDGTLVTFHDGSHVGESTHPVRGEAHGNALTNSETYALRRAAINLGDQFGLSLYNKGSLAPIVRWTLVQPEAGMPDADTDDVPKVSAEDSSSSSAGSDEPQNPGEPPAEPPAPDPAGRGEPPWLNDAIEQAATLKDEKAAGSLWQEAVEKSRNGEISGEDKERVRVLVGARVEELRLNAMAEALSLLSETDEWRQKIEELDGDDSAREALAEVGRTVSNKVRAGRITHAITVRWPRVADGQERAPSRLTPAQQADAASRRREGRPDIAAMTNEARRDAGLMDRRQAAEHERLATVPHTRTADRSRGPNPDDLWAQSEPSGGDQDAA